VPILFTGLQAREWATWVKNALLRRLHALVGAWQTTPKRCAKKNTKIMASKLFTVTR